MRDIETLISQMTLEEKAALCIGASAWTTVEVERLGIPAIVMSDGPHGVRRVQDESALAQKSLPATSFPTAACAAATWNTDLIQKMGEAMAEEALAQGVDILLGPGVNIKRTPLCGRNFEYYSEDPFLAGKMGSSLIRGIQGKGVGTSLKHFTANNQEFQRFTISAEVEERALREIYLRAFEMAVKDARPWTVMCAYNKLNGTYCSEHHPLLGDILKMEWGFEGLVVSDWGAVHDRVASLQGGLDLEMPGPQDNRLKAVIAAIESGDLEPGLLDEAVRRILRIVLMAQESEKGGSFDERAHHQLAREIAAEGMVLLKNDGILPLKNVDRIAVIGQAAQTPYYQGGGSSHVNPTQLDVPLEELRKAAGDIQLDFAQGYPKADTFDRSLINEAVEIAKSADLALLFLALPASKESEGYDRPDLDLTEHQIALIDAVTEVQSKTVVVINSGSAISMQPWLEKVNALLQAWMMGQAGGGAIADILFGKINPSGKLSETFPKRLEDTPAHINFPGDSGKVHYGEGLYVGYRYYEAKKIPVQFPFGFGLSYTTFAFSNLQMPEEFKDIDGMTISLDVTNTGDVAGKETVQVYVHDQESTLSRPFKELKGFAKVKLEPGETKTVSIPLDFRAFAFYHPRYHTWITEDGDFDILVGASSNDIRLQATVKMTSTLKLPCLLDRESTLKEWLTDPRGYQVLKPLLEELQTRFEEVMVGEEEMGLDPMAMIIDMPLTSILMFQQAAFTIHVEEIVDELLEKAHAIDG
jgi:beta-glucosidase